MTNRPAKFTAADIRRAVKIATEAGKIVELTPDGTIRIRDAVPDTIPASTPKDEETWPEGHVL